MRPIIRRVRPELDNIPLVYLLAVFIFEVGLLHKDKLRVFLHRVAVYIIEY